MKFSKRLTIAACLAGLVLGLTDASAGRPESGPGVEHARLTGADRIIDDLLVWIGKHTDYDVTEARRYPPPVSLVDAGATVDYEGEPVSLHEGVQGFYDRAASRVFLTRPWDPDDTRALGTLLHELVHYVQHLDRDWPCWRQTEWEAYELEETWLAEHGVEADLNWMYIASISSCRVWGRNEAVPRHRPGSAD